MRTGDKITVVLPTGLVRGRVVRVVHAEVPAVQYRFNRAGRRVLDTLPVNSRGVIWERGWTGDVIKALEVAAALRAS